MLGDTRFQRRIQLPAHPHFTFLPTVDPLFQIRAPVGKLWSCAPAHGRPRSHALVSIYSARSCAPAHGRPRSCAPAPGPPRWATVGRIWALALNSIYNTTSLFVPSPYPFLICNIPLSFPYLGFPFIYLFSANSVLGFI